MNKYQEIKNYLLDLGFTFKSVGNGEVPVSKSGTEMSFIFDDSTQTIIRQSRVNPDEDLELFIQTLATTFVDLESGTTNLSDILQEVEGEDYDFIKDDKVFVLHGCTHRSTRNKRATFKVDHKNKTVTCTLICTADVRDKSSIDAKLFNLYVPKKARTIKTTITISCKDGDDFDEEFGKRLAFAKARISCLKMMRALIEDFRSKLDDISDKYWSEYDRYDFAIQQHIDDYTSLVDGKYGND